MKTIAQKLVLLVTLLLLACYGFSQSRYGYYQATTMDVNGIFIGGIYTKQQVEEKWGTPTEYWSGMSEFGLNEEYTYNNDEPNNLFRFSDDGMFVSFFIETADFIVYTQIDGGIKVGDPISRIEPLGLGTPVLQGNGKYHVHRNNADDPLVFEHVDGIITRISFVTSI